MPPQAPVIIWFRNDLRLADNPALFAAAQSGRAVIPVYIHDDVNAGDWKSGSATKYWLHQSLAALDTSLQAAGFHPLVFLKGDADTEIKRLVEGTGAAAIFWNRRYEPWSVKLDAIIGENLKKNNISVHSFNGFLLFEPWEIANKAGGSYRIFTPYSKACFDRGGIRAPLEAPSMSPVKPFAKGLRLAGLELMPRKKWYAGIAACWTPGEVGAKQRLDDFLDGGLRDYKAGRDYPALEGVSRLSPHLHFGEISPHIIWHAVSARAAQSPHTAIAVQAQGYLRQLIWREFSWYLLYHFPALPEKPWHPQFMNFAWQKDARLLAAWQRGLTGYPIIDAGMRQLWQTGWMHNRLRMLTGSFLVKNLLQHWRAGEDWFWETLVDADLGNNAQGWQWIAGCGADAAPYFRIFNPILQGRKFDAEGAYIKTYVPELKELPAQYIHAPWEAPPSALKQAGVVLGRNYPHRIVELDRTRAQALKVYHESK